MTLTLPDLLRLAWETIRAPREAARVVMGVDLPRTARWEALFALVMVGTLLAIAITYLFTGDLVMYLGVIPATPITAAIISVSASVITVFAIYWIGTALGGSGGFGDAILLVAWTQFVVICMQLAQLVTFLLLPAISVLIEVAASVISVWILTNFIAELHGFKSLAKVFLMMLVSLFGLAFGVTLILAVIGVSVPEVSP